MEAKARSETEKKHENAYKNDLEQENGVNFSPSILIGFSVR